MTQLELDPGTDATIARCHTLATRRIGELARPPVLDAGPATGDLLAICSRLVGTAGQLAVVSAATAAAVRAVGAELGSTDEQLHARFERLRGGS
ncbi:hypothetical protein [Nocardioides pantholopis]|uniref:hypothetical protein n=1 Tax=Nocardioides pantholopis TaxID=2483798 RepID=UPI000F089D8E|nr:hypothetical protein [Nocardioides pantholopis]